uniref:Uncharacterized protein n=1 Tax=Romanomermis culicivorax TaxID=13658 RepID=A0A915LAT4_ROMCU
VELNEICGGSAWTSLDLPSSGQASSIPSFSQQQQCEVVCEVCKTTVYKDGDFVGACKCDVQRFKLGAPLGIHQPDVQKTIGLFKIVAPQQSQPLSHDEVSTEVGDPLTASSDTTSILTQVKVLSERAPSVPSHVPSPPPPPPLVDPPTRTTVQNLPITGV